MAGLRGGPVCCVAGENGAMRGFLASVMVLVLAACGSPNRSVGALVTPYPAGSPDAQEVHTALAISACSIAASLDRGRVAYQALLAAHDES